MRRRGALLAVAAATAPAGAGKPVLYGYDVVEYFSLDAAAPGVMGHAEFAANLTTTDQNKEATQHMLPTNWTFWFKDAANQAAFEADPWRYAPQWGGF